MKRRNTARTNDTNSKPHLHLPKQRLLVVCCGDGIFGTAHIRTVVDQRRRRAGRADKARKAARGRRWPALIKRKERRADAAVQCRSDPI